MNKSFLSGNIGNDPELVQTSSGWTCFKFSIANNDESKKLDDGSYEKVTSWFDLEYWTKNDGHWGMKLKKGASVTCECEAKQNTWKKDGQNRSKIIFKVVKFPTINERQESKSQAPASTPPQNPEDDIPF